MKVTVASIFVLFSSAALAGANALEQRDLQLATNYEITWVSTTAAVIAGPDDIVTIFTHSDVTDLEGSGAAAYGTVDVKYYNVLNQDCYNAQDDADAAAINLSSTCTCSTSNEVNSPTGGAFTITPAFVTVDNLPTDDKAMTTITDELAPLFNSDAATVVGDKIYVAYCVRLSLKTTPGDLLANSQDVLVYFTGTNNINANFGVTAKPEASGDSGESVADFTVTAKLCSGTVGLNAATPLLEGSDVAICIESNDDPAAAIVGITTWDWKYTRTDTTTIITQPAIGTGTAANALTNALSCSGAAGTTPSKCQFTTLFGTAIYDAMVADSAVTGAVVGTGLVSMKFNGENRRARVLLKAGDVFGSPASLDLTLAAPKEEEEETGSCDCFFLNIFCWIMCLLRALFSF
jgi:hypothetical protein